MIRRQQPPASDRTNRQMRLLHISDIHVGTPHVGSHQQLVLERLIEAVESEVQEGGDFDILAITGDVVWGQDSNTIPLTEQWNQAAALVPRLQNAAGIESGEQVLIAPGNHDLTRARVNQVNRAFMRTCDWHKFDRALGESASRPNLLAGLREFDDFLTTLGLPGSGRFLADGYYSTVLNINGTTYGVGVGNTAFAAFGPHDGVDDQNHLHFGQSQLNKLVLDLRHCDTTILLTHHPVTWLTNPEEMWIDGRIRDEFDIHLHGHEHRLTVNDTSTLLHLATGATYDHEASSVRNYFSSLEIDPDVRSARLRVWELTDDSGHQWRPTESVRFENGYKKELQAGHLFPKIPTEPPALLAQPAGVAAVPPTGPRSMIALLEERYRFRWITGDYTEDGFASSVFWPVRLRAPTIIHAVQAFVAGGLVAQGAEVNLVVDDLGDPDTNNRQGLERKLRAWMDLVNPESSAQLTVTYLRDALDTAEAAAAGWAIVRSWWSVPTETLHNVFAVSKLVGDGKLWVDSAERSPRKLMSPPMIWAGLAQTYATQTGRAVITLCGDDERSLWDTWQRYCTKSDQLPAGHLFIPSLVDSSGNPIHMGELNLTWQDQVELAEFLSTARAQGNYPALAWLSQYCVDLPCELRGEEIPGVISQESHLGDESRIDMLRQKLAVIVGQ